MSTKRAHYTGWAIRQRYDGREWLWGRYTWMGGPTPIPDCMIGHHIMLFQTRRQARRALRDKRMSMRPMTEWSRKFMRFTTVVKVRVRIEDAD